MRTMPTHFKKDGNKIVCLTAYSAVQASILDKHVDMILVGDSLGMVLYGMESTIGVTLEMMRNHAAAVVRASKKACVLVDMPFGSYQESPQQAFRNASWLMRETGCQCVKIEGGLEMCETVEYLTHRGIPVMAHIGLRPQSLNTQGGYKMQGKTEAARHKLLLEAKAHEVAGAFALLLEGMREDAATEITRSLKIPTIGIGASKHCDGQVLVTDDVLGMHNGHYPAFVQRQAELYPLIENAVASYAESVRNND